MEFLRTISLLVSRPGRSGGGMKGGCTTPFTGLRGGSRSGGGAPGEEAGGVDMIPPPGRSNGLRLKLSQPSGSSYKTIMCFFSMR